MTVCRLRSDAFVESKDTVDMRVEANCKINLGLDVLRRRDDGYHDIETVMYPLRGLYDVLEIEPSETSGAELVTLGIEVDCPPEKNICLKAYELLRRSYGVGGVRITLDKRVPFGAGLGGGSSDGTAVILALNEMFSLGMDEAALIEAAAELGSDTPFFVRNTPLLCEGRGERMTPVAVDLEGWWIAVVKPAESVSTREAYAGVTPHTPVRPLAERIAEPVERWQGSVVNDFEKSVFASHPAIGRVKQSLLEAGAVYASMSGSGSAVFGLFDDGDKAEAMRGKTSFIYRL